jgi:acetylornithine/succinyldiaminopimelate/putrescine aminotransferase
MTLTKPAGTEGASPTTTLEKLRALRAFGGERLTKGLPDDVVERFLERDANLALAVDRAWDRALELRAADHELLDADEAVQVRAIQGGIVNFYGEPMVSPYVALGAGGPWVVTAKGAVVHDSGGYGMLGLGHTPETVLRALARPQVMANVMTPNFSQHRIIAALKAEIGQTRAEGCPFGDFLFMNSGSESVTVAARLADVNAKLMTDPGGCYEGRPIRRLGLVGGFHGRTDRPAQWSDSTMPAYVDHLATFRDRDRTITIPPNDVDALQEAFRLAEERGEFLEAFFMEPVMGEGNPGLAITREFYDAARALTKAHGAVLLVDSIQAGFRACGMLSIVDYPGFEDCDPPDLETYSKALNAGQYPMSVLAMTPKAAALYRPGIYGNTMTTAPRALDIAVAVLESITPELRKNIRERGAEFLGLLQDLQEEMGGRITHVQGTGLLVCCGLDPERYMAYGTGSTEEYLRAKGFGVIHGGKNALRYTPHFAVTSEEIRLIVDSIRDAVLHGPTR